MADNTNIHLNIILNQVQAAEQLAQSTLPADHVIQFILRSAVQSIQIAVDGNAGITPIAQAPAEPAPVAPKYPAVALPVVPAPVAPADETPGVEGIEGIEDIRMAGLTPDDFFQVMEEVPEEIAQIFANAGDDENDILDETGITGVIEKDGELVEIGDFDANAARMEALVNEAEEEMGEAFDEPEHAVNIRYTRLDGQALTVDQTLTILNHPVSRPLHNLGKLRFDRIVETDNDAEKVARFEIEDASRAVLVGMAMGAIAYAGIKVFPGLGQVQANGFVNFDF